MTRSSATRSARLLVNGRLTPRSKCSLEEEPRARGLLQGIMRVATVPVIATNTIWTRMASSRTLGAGTSRDHTHIHRVLAHALAFHGSKSLVEDMLPAEAWRHFQAVGAARTHLIRTPMRHLSS